MYTQVYFPAVKSKNPSGARSTNALKPAAIPEAPSSAARRSRQSGGSEKTTAKMTKNWMKSHASVALSPPRNV